MIFCTVGTHEDPFDRLLRALDALPGDEPVRIQSGYSTYVPTRCSAEAMMPYARIQSSMQEARIVITHGGPASIMQALSHGKVPIVVPRQSAFGEHVDDHQVRFARKIADRVLVILDIAELAPLIAQYDERVAGLGPSTFGPERARLFAMRLDDLTQRLLARP
ncbi:MAG: glycosyltransferase [Pseudomonadota bacterium]|nr:glycosyltransferase [Pseudomonadota bacterium]